MPIALQNEITTLDQLRAIIPEWSGNATLKDHDRLNATARPDCG